ncbi:signal peptidase I [Simiduia curdlanivorans]|uniref:Signal peptidase I n=1 Tax=Simiduia curdlanivorans TaxID=1492769 RepID=A0ABV8V142_9GAMM|nr:signal peptidase I [Simiduia curdlanivorans]MDN3637892.1 signal peptidase I [Simiduia curdlanivorans]
MATQSIKQLWRENRGLILFLALMFVFRSTFADWNSVPTGSMLPTIVEGDRILVNKMAYDIRLPFIQLPLIKLGDPEHGDIIVFESSKADKRLVKRVIGLPGDTVGLRDNQLFINGEKIPLLAVTETAQSRLYQEALFAHQHLIQLAKKPSPLASFATVKVPKNSYLALGDNRDNSADSRVIGFVPRREIIGRTRQVVLSFDPDNHYFPRKDRLLKTL